MSGLASPRGTSGAMAYWPSIRRPAILLAPSHDVAKPTYLRDPVPFPIETYPPVSVLVAAASHAFVPLSLLEAVRDVDAPVKDGLDEFHEELAVKRLGMSATVAAQIDRYRRMAFRDDRIEGEEVVALLRLVGRRPDADLVFGDAGRRAGRYATRRLGVGARLSLRGLPRFARSPLAFALARRAAARVFDASVRSEKGLIVATIKDPPSAVATPGGEACGFYGAAIAETFRALTDFDGAMLHVSCRARGESICGWRAAAAHGE